MNDIRKLLIANRGEIACRIMRTCRDMGIATAAVHSDADRDALHVAMAGEAVGIGPPPAQESYLNIDAVLAAAVRTGSDAIHPGYGFLAENADFARAVISAGLTWIGPSPDTIAAMGDKQRARAIARDAGVPVLPGSGRLDGETGAALENLAGDIGYPLLVKAAAGGGGIGMRIVESRDRLAAEVEATRKLALRLFGDAGVYLERYVPHARHVEVQVFGFGDGQGVHLFDRDCTVQRRFQKVIEEAPAPLLDEVLRFSLRDAALALVRDQSYSGAGTVEFIYDRDRGEAYFLEMNTRIQVEHAATEIITGIDLVRWQIEMATGRLEHPLQSAVTSGGAAIECRLYAERPEKNFLPSPGTLDRLRLPDATDDLRIDTGVREGDLITRFYDPLIAKIIARGRDRDAAIARMRAALDDVEVAGLGTNLAFLKDVLDDPEFAAMRVTTRYVETWQAG